MDELLKACAENLVNVEFVFDFDGNGACLFGVRLRPYGKRAPKNKMVLGGGRTSLEALQQAVDKARANRWENIDWSARPWLVDQPAATGTWFE